MRRFKFIRYNVWTEHLTLDKVYVLLGYTKRDIIEIENDNGDVCEYVLYNPKTYESLFKEVTTEYRNEVIDGILK